MVLSLVATIGSTAAGHAAITSGATTVLVGTAIPIAVAGSLAVPHLHWHPECGSNGCYIGHPANAVASTLTVFAEGLPVHRVLDARICLGTDVSNPPVSPSITTTTTTANVFCGI